MTPWHHDTIASWHIGTERAADLVLAEVLPGEVAVNVLGEVALVLQAVPEEPGGAAHAEGLGR